MASYCNFTLKHPVWERDWKYNCLVCGSYLINRYEVRCDNRLLGKITKHSLAICDCNKFQTYIDDSGKPYHESIIIEKIFKISIVSKYFDNDYLLSAEKEEYMKYRESNKKITGLCFGLEIYPNETVSLNTNLVDLILNDKNQYFDYSKYNQNYNKVISKLNTINTFR